MNKTIFLILIVASLGLMTSAAAQAVHAKIPNHSYLKLPLEVVAYTNGKKVRDITVWAEYKDEVEKFKWNMKGQLEHEFEFDFPPLQRGFFDFYRVCVENHRNEQIRCQDGYWFPGTDSTYMRILVP